MRKSRQKILLILSLIFAVGTLLLQFCAIYTVFYALLFPWSMDPPGGVGMWHIRLNNFFDSGEPPFDTLFYISAGFSLLLASACVNFLVKDMLASQLTTTRIERVFAFAATNLSSLPLFLITVLLGKALPLIWLQQDQPLSYIDVLPGGLFFLSLLVVVPYLHRRAGSTNDSVKSIFFRPNRLFPKNPTK